MRFAVIGCGWITGAVHAPAYLHYISQNADFEAAACCDIDPSRAEAVRSRFGFKQAYTSATRMLAVEKPDAVCLNVPPGLTSELGCEVLRQGIALLCEKPPGLNPVELERMISAAAEGRAAHMVAFNRRWMPLVRALRQRLGKRKVEHVQYTLSRVGRKDEDFSTTAVHAVDAVRTLAGSDYRRVQISWQELPEVGPGAANFALCAEMASGALAEIAVTPLAGMVVERAFVSARDWTAELRCPTGMDKAGGLKIFASGKLDEALDGAEEAGGEEDWRLGGFYQEDAAFFDALRGGETPPDGLESARQAVEIMQALRERRREVVFA